ncbi:MAG: hypothetical protein KBA61_04155 [Spirochaetes bacterium]|nr:hypothetical protein [Spirochaetota bacterium]
MLLLPTALLAESVFINDGSIIEGIIENKNDSTITIRKTNNLRVEIPRNLVIRTINDDSYKAKVTIKLKKEPHLVGHIVEKDAVQCVVRKNLTETAEITIQVADIIEIRPYTESSIHEQKKIEVPKSSPGQQSLDPRRAARLSLIPITSGSFMVEYNAWGISFVALKSLSMLLPLSVILPQIFSTSNSESSDSDSSGSTDPLRNNSTLRTATYISAGIWVLATAGDMYYSYRHVGNYNNRVSRSSSNSVEFHVLQARVPICPMESQAVSHETITDIFFSYHF